MSHLVKNCLVVNVQVGVWLGHKLDKVTTNKVIADNSASPDAGRFNKHLIPKECLKDILSAAGVVRNYVYTQTLPWKDNGDRLLTRAIATKFIEQHEINARKFYDEVNTFLDKKYVTAMDQAEFRMGELFNLDDYPTARELKRKFYVNLDIDGVAEGKDIRLHDSSEIMQARVTKAMEGLWERLADPLKHFATTMSQEDKTFRDSTLGNLQAIVDLMPELNFTDDPKLERIRQEIAAELLTYEPKELRTDKLVRKAVAGKAAEIMDEMAGYMSAFSGGDE